MMRQVLLQPVVTNKSKLYCAAASYCGVFSGKSAGFAGLEGISKFKS